MSFFCRLSRSRTKCICTIHIAYQNCSYDFLLSPYGFLIFVHFHFCYIRFYWKFRLKAFRLVQLAEEFCALIFGNSVLDNRSQTSQEIQGTSVKLPPPHEKAIWLAHQVIFNKKKSNESHENSKKQPLEIFCRVGLEFNKMS